MKNEMAKQTEDIISKLDEKLAPLTCEVEELRDNYTPSKHWRVCKKHFNPDDYALPKEPNTENPTPKLKPKAVPIVDFAGTMKVKRQRERGY
ncbi:unnamed protein product [Parnassius apollo]|uniref:(apollo) hypothetical protein n=1 Tax=Parnassius apollo TaxID=110799 RepID=A0A8S3WKG5_PARAO|nr:unnamed protein product [Parnassius apollo]